MVCCRAKFICQAGRALLSEPSAASRMRYMRPFRWGACRQSGILTLSLCQKDGPKGTPDLRGAISGGVHSHTSVTVGKGLRMGEGHLLLLSGKALDISLAPS